MYLVSESEDRLGSDNHPRRQRSRKREQIYEVTSLHKKDRAKNSGQTGSSGQNEVVGSSGQTGSSGQNEVVGSSGQTGSSGQNEMVGGSGQNEMVGGSGQNEMVGISGQNEMVGGSGLVGISGQSEMVGISGQSEVLGISGQSVDEGSLGQSSGQNQSDNDIKGETLIQLIEPNGVPYHGLVMSSSSTATTQFRDGDDNDEKTVLRSRTDTIWDDIRVQNEWSQVSYEGGRECVREERGGSGCVCGCVWVGACVCCVCVCERERERESVCVCEGEGEGETKLS